MVLICIFACFWPFLFIVTTREGFDAFFFFFFFSLSHILGS